MKSAIAGILALAFIAQASAVSIVRPAVSRPTLIRPIEPQAPAPCSASILIRPRPIQEQPQVLLPNDRPLTPADILALAEQETNTGAVVYPWAPRPSVGQQKPSVVVLPEDRPLRPSDLLSQQEIQEEESVFVLPNDRPLRPSDFVQVVEKKPVFVLPNDRPLRPSDLLQVQEQPAIRPVPINQQLVGGPDQFIQVRPQVVAEEKPVFLLPNDRPLRPSDLLQVQEQPAIRPVPINQQLVGGPDQFIQVRPQVVAEEKPVFLLPNDRPLRPSDLLQVQEQQPAVRPVPINQQLVGGPDQFIQVRPVVEEKPVFVLPNDRPLRPSDLMQVQEQQPAIRPVPINQQLVGGPDQFIQVRPQVVAEEKPVFVLPNDRPLRPSDLLGLQEQPSVRPVPINQQLVGGPDQFIQIRPQVVAEEKPVFVLPNDRPLRPSDLLQVQEQQPAIRPVPINQQLIGGPDQFIQIRPVAEEQPVFVLPNDRPLRPSDFLPQQQNNGRPLPADIIF